MSNSLPDTAVSISSKLAITKPWAPDNGSISPPESFQIGNASTNERKTAHSLFVAVGSAARNLHNSTLFVERVDSASTRASVAQLLIYHERVHIYHGAHLVPHLFARQTSAGLLIAHVIRYEDNRGLKTRWRPLLAYKFVNAIRKETLFRCGSNHVLSLASPRDTRQTCGLLLTETSIKSSTIGFALFFAYRERKNCAQPAWFNGVVPRNTETVMFHSLNHLLVFLFFFYQTFQKFAKWLLQAFYQLCN